VPEDKLISLDKLAEDEEKSFFEQLLQEGARELLQAAIEEGVMDYFNSTRIAVREWPAAGCTQRAPAGVLPYRSNECAAPSCADSR
jgi:hypothetical protein